MAENSYSTKVYSTLKDNIDGFNKTEDEFNESLKDPAYVSKVHKALSETIDGFNKSESDFSSALGYPKQSAPSQGAESGLSNFIQAPKTSGLSDYTGKPISTSTSPSASTSSVGVESKLKADQIRTLKSFAFNKQQALKNAEVVKPIEPEVSSTIEDLYNSFKAGSAKLGSMAAKTPAFLYDIAAVPQNLVAKYTGLDVGVNANEFAQKYNLPENEVAKYYDEAYKQAKVNIDAKYDKSITEYIANGEYAKATKSIMNQVLESAPVSISLMAGNAAGVTPLVSTIAGGAVFGAEKKAELDANNPNMDEATKTLIAVGNGLMEGVFENAFGVTKLGTITKNVLEKEGAEAAKEVAEKSFKEVYAPIFKKYVGIGFEEPLGEAATQFSQNVITKYSGENPNLNLTDGLADAAIVGLGSGVAFSLPTAAIDLIKTKDARVQAKDLQNKKESIESDLVNPTVPNEVKNILSEQAKNINASLADLHVDDNVATLHLSEELKQQIIQNNKTIDSLESAISDMSISEDSRKIIEAKKKELESQNEEILNTNKISKPIKYTSPTNDLYGYVEENGVKRDLTKQEFEDYGKVDMEQQVAATTTEEPQRVGEGTQEIFTTDQKGKSEPIELSIEPSRVETPTKEINQENIDKINYTLRDNENNVLVRLPLSSIETGVPKGNIFAEQRKSAAQAHLEGAVSGHDKENTATQASLDKDGNLFIADGRHRVEAQKDSGVEYGWFEVPKDQAKEIESKYETPKSKEAVVPSEKEAMEKNISEGEQQKAEDVEAINDRISVSGLRDGHTISGKTSSKTTKDSAQYKETFDPRTSEGENYGESFVKTIERKGKKYRVVGLRMSNPKTIINGQRDRSGMSYASIVDDGNLPSNINDLLIKRAIQEGKDLYEDVVKLEDFDFTMPSEYKPTTKKSEDVEAKKAKKSPVNEKAVLDVKNARPIEETHVANINSGEVVIGYHAAPNGNVDTGKELGIHIGTKEVAETIKEGRNKGEGDVKQVSFRVNKPLILGDMAKWNSIDILGELYRQKLIPLETLKKIRDSSASEKEKQKQIIDIIKSKGYDSIAYQNNDEGNGEYSYVLFDKSQLSETPIKKELQTNNKENEADNIQSNREVYVPPTTEEGIKSERSRIESEEAENGVRTGVEKINDIAVRPDIFQFKAQDEASGVNLAEKLQGNFDVNLAGAIGVWKDEKGELGEKGKVYVVDGHHRMEFAKRSGVKNMNVFYIDAPTAKDARVTGAKANIAQGRGTSIDAAKVYKEATPKQLEGFKPTSRVAKEGMELAKLENSVFNLVVQGKLDIPTAMAIAKVEKPKQESFYKAIKRIEDSGAIKMTSKGLSVMAEKISSGGVAVNKVQEMDLFGTTEQEELLLAEQSQLESDIKDELAKDAKILGSANKNKAVLEKAENVVNEEVNAKLAEQSRLASGLFDTYKNRKEVSDIIKQATIDLNNAKGRKQRAEIKDKATSDVKKAIEAELNKDFNKENNKENGIQEQSTGEVLQREQGKVGEAGSERQGVESSQQGQETTEQGKEENVNKVKSELKSNELKASNENENYIRPVMNEEAKPNINTGIEILPSERADEAESNLVIVQSKKYYTLWLKIPNKSNKGIQYTYLTTLSTNLDEARSKANDYIQKLKEGQKLSVAFNGKNMADIGDRKSIALREDVMMEKDLDKRNVSIKSVASLPLGLDTKLGFGKYANSTIGEIIENDSSYASWLSENAQRQDIRDLIKSHPTFQQIEDIRELERERIKAFEEREKRREEGENVSVVTLVRGEGNKIVEKNEDTVPKVKNVEKKEKRVVKDQIKDIIPPNTQANDNVRDKLKPKMFQSQIDGANTAIQSMNDNGVVLNGDGAGVGKTRQIIAVADHFAKKGKVVVIISENAAIGKPFEKVGAYKLGGSMEKDSQEMGVKINLLEGGVEKGNIYISTYNRIKDSDIPKGAIVIFDESQNLANTFGRSPDANNKEEKQWEAKFKSILNKAQATAYYSATPADKPHQLAYLHKILGFETPEAFLAAAVENGTQIKTRKFGREEIKYYDVPSSSIRRKKLYDWVNGLMVKAGQEGRFIKREISYEGTDVQFHDVKGTNESTNEFAGLFNDVIQQMSLAERDGYKLLAPNSYILYAAELAKIGEAVKMAKREKAAGRKVIIFVSRIKEMEIRGKRKQMDGSWSEPIVVGKIPSPVEILRKELEKDGITFVELHGSSKMSSQKAQKEFNEKADALVASLESGGTGINLDDTKGDSPRTEIFMFSPYRGISTIQGMGRIWRASTIQNDNKPNRYVFITTSDIAPDIARSGVLAKKLQLMNAAIGGTAVSKLPMSKVNYDVKQLVGIELPDEGEESAINKDKTGILKPVEIEFKKSSKGNLFAEANADLLEWVERGGVERTGLNIKIFKGDNGRWIALSDKQYKPEEYAPEGINEGVSALETKELNTKENDKEKANETNRQVVLEGVREAGDESQGRKSSEQLQEEIADLRAKEQAEYDAMSDPNDKVKRQEIYDRYDELITSLIREQKALESTDALKDVESTAKALEILNNETPTLKTQKTLTTNGLPNLDIVASKESSSALESEIGGDIGGIDNKVRTIPIQEYDVTENNRSRQIAEQIEENGWIEPLIVSYDKNGNVYIVEGQHRAAALKQLGYDKAPVIVIYNKSSNIGKAVESLLSKEQTPAKEEAPALKDVKPIRQLGTGANVYFETNKHRVNDDLKSGKVLLNVGSKEDEVPMANIKFDNAAEAVAVAKELDRIYPKGVPNAVLIDKVVEDIRKKQAQEVKTKPLSEEIADLRAKEQAEYDAMSNPNDKAKRDEIYDRYNKEIITLLREQKALESTDALKDVESTAKEQMSDNELQQVVGRDVFKQIQRSEEQLGEGVVDRNRMIETAQKIQKADKKDKLLPEHIFEALQYETGFSDNWQDLRNAVKKGGIDLNSEAIQRQIEVGVKLPKDIVEEFKKSERYKNANPELVKAVESLLSKEQTKTTKPTEKAQEGKAEQDYQEAISKKSERAKNNAKEKFINDNFDKIVSQLMLENKIKRKC